MQAREYLPAYGKFAEVDPAYDQTKDDPESWNLYNYTTNNPVTHTDPDGRIIDDPVQDKASAGEAAAGAAYDSAMLDMFLYQKSEEAYRNELAAQFAAEWKALTVVLGALGVSNAGQVAYAMLTPSAHTGGSGSSKSAQTKQDVNADRSASEQAIKLLYGVEKAPDDSLHADGRYYAYADSSGITTIGTGHKVEAGEDFSKGLSKPQVDALFHQDIKRMESWMHANFGVKLDQAKWDALLLTLYNFGTGSQAHPKIISAIKGGRIDRAMKSYLFIVKRAVTQSPVSKAGQLIRIQKELDLWSNGVYPSRLTR